MSLNGGGGAGGSTIFPSYSSYPQYPVFPTYPAFPAFQSVMPCQSPQPCQPFQPFQPLQMDPFYIPPYDTVLRNFGSGIRSLIPEQGVFNQQQSPAVSAQTTDVPEQADSSVVAPGPQNPFNKVLDEFKSREFKDGNFVGLKKAEQNKNTYDVNTGEKIDEIKSVISRLRPIPNRSHLFGRNRKTKVSRKAPKKHKRSRKTKVSRKVPKKSSKRHKRSVKK
jgi:hypothetical protein